MALQTLLQPKTTDSAPLTSRIPAPMLAEEGVRKTCDCLADAWCRGDSTALAAVLTQDCDHVALTPVRHVKRGRAALVESWREAFARRGPGFSVRISVVPHRVRLMNDDLALVDGALMYSEGIGAADVRHGRASQLFTAVMIRSETNWLIQALRVGPLTAGAKVVPCPED